MGNRVSSTGIESTEKSMYDMDIMEIDFFAEWEAPERLTDLTLRGTRMLFSWGSPQHEEAIKALDLSLLMPEQMPGDDIHDLCRPVEMAAKLGVSSRGLSNKEALARSKIHGPNRIPTSNKGRGFLKSLTEGFGQVSPGLFRKHDQLIEAMEKLKTSPSIVYREGRLMLLHNSEIVVGDLVLVISGSYPPADMLILCVDGVVTVDVCALTGEPDPVQRDVGNSLYLGSSIPEFHNFSS